MKNWPAFSVGFDSVWDSTVRSGFAPPWPSEPPSPPTYDIRMENAWIPMKDGVRLAVTLYMPDGGKAGEKFPAVLEYHPYRKDDATAERDYPLYAYFVRRGYVCARVDIRGFGTSEGVPTGPRVLRAGTTRWPADHRLAGASTVVQRQRGHDGHFLERLQFPADGHAARARAQSHHRGGRHGGAFPRRRALHRRHGAHRRVRVEHGHGARHDRRSRLHAR